MKPIKPILLALGALLYAGCACAYESPLLWSATRSENISPFYKWTGMMARYARQQQVPDSECGHAPYHPCEVVHWKMLLSRLQNADASAQLSLVNAYANAYPYITDWENWGVADYWETPYEFLAMSGNCKDYAIAKYYSLRALGIPAERLRVIIVQDNNLGGIIHAILGVYDEGELYILDNQIKQIVPARRILHYQPLYAINEQAWWRYLPK